MGSLHESQSNLEEVTCRHGVMTMSCQWVLLFAAWYSRRFRHMQAHQNVT